LRRTFVVVPRRLAAVSILCLMAVMPLLSSQPRARGEEAAALTYVINDTGQDKCYDDAGKVIPPPPSEKSFHGQDAQYPGTQMRFQDNGDGTVSDLNTGLVWQKAVGVKVSWEDAKANAVRINFGGKTDWRLPSIKELYSLIDFNGMAGRDERSSVPYIQTRYFDFRYGDAGERLIDAQYWTTTRYVSTTMNGDQSVFGVNFADGRIKAYPISSPRDRETPNKLFVRYVRGNPEYGKNKFTDNGDGTITDSATGLMWMKTDSGPQKAGEKEDGRLNWRQALKWAENLDYAGHKDWRLPNAKELQSIVDYTRSPATTNSAAIDPMFGATMIADPAGRPNYPCYWTGTSHLDGPTPGSGAVYVAFGKAQGFMEFPPRSGRWSLLDVHGAGAQRSDPKSGDPAQFPRGRGPQGDVILIYNFARCVRDAKTQ